MSPKFPSLTATGVMAVGVLWGATRSVAEPQDAPPLPVPQAARPGSPAPSEASRPTVLLLSDGRILQGEIVEDPTGYFLKHKIGVKHFTRRNVLGTFRSLDEVYQFKRARVPQDDPDEQMKLALWCLEQKLNEPAREHLTQVMALSPDNPRAKSMLMFLADRGLPPGDPAVARTGADVIADPAAAPASLGAGAEAGMPRELPRRALDEIRNADRDRRRQAGPPVIFDLAPAVAMKRYEEFGRVVHLKLQNHCAKCHDADTHSGAFRLVKASARRDLTNDLLLRTNLDATLQLVNPDDPAHSELLSVMALTHPPDGRPVLGGPNHPDYRIIQLWIAGMSRPTVSAPAAATAAPGIPPRLQPVPGGDLPADGFAVGRAGGAGIAPEAVPAPLTGSPKVVAPANSGTHDLRGMSGQVEATAPGVPGSAQFPDPGLPQAAARPGRPGAAAAAGPGGDLIVQQPDGTQAIRLPNGELVPYVSREAARAPRDAATTPAVAPDEPSPPSPAPAPAPAPAPSALPAVPGVGPAGAAGGSSTAAEAATTARKKPKLDPNALQKFLQNRGAPR